MYANAKAKRTRVDRRLLAGLFVGILVAASLAFVLDSNERFTFASPPSPGDGNAPTAGGRDPLLWPFSRDSVWNLPIGSDARYVWAGIRPATQMAYFTDADVLILEPTAPMTTVYTNNDDWGAGTRCGAQGPALFTAPIPSDFIVPGSHQGSEDGDTPNAATAILAADGHTLIQTQPFAKCAGYAPTSHYMFGTEDLYGTGETGSHGGSGLSALGGTVRLGEIVPGGAIRHALKLNIDNINFYSGTPHGSPAGNGYRWPAWKSDGYGYPGSNPAVAPGSLLAVKPDFDVASLESEPGRIVAQAFQNYGGYIVDTSGWSVYNFVTEHSPKGSVRQEFQRVWGYDMSAGVGANGWARDLMKIFTNLYAVDNWDHGTWQTVSASAGALGVGLGAPRVAWAPEFGEALPPPPPPRPPPPFGGVATTLTLGTSKNPSAINETVTVSGRLIDASGVPLSGRSVFLEWSGDQTTWYPEAQIGQFPATDANGVFFGSMAFLGVGAHDEYIRARFGGDATYAASLSPVLTQGVVLPPTSPPTDPPLPTQPGTGPTMPLDAPPTIVLLTVLSLCLAGAGGLLYRPARRGRAVATMDRRSTRNNSRSPRHRSFDGVDDDIDYLL